MYITVLSSSYIEGNIRFSVLDEGKFYCREYS